MTVVTPEAVQLDFAPAGVASRMLALFLDLLAQLGALLALGIVVGLSTDGGLSETAALIIGLVGIFLILFGYPVLSETLASGRTLGKAALGLRVRTTEGTPVRFRHAAIRGALGLVDFWLTTGLAATLSVLLTRDSQRLGDLAAGTLVLRERQVASATAGAVVFAPPPGWEQYAATLDVASVSREQYGLVRNFLLRAHELTPGARHHLALRLAEPLRQVLAHTLPPGVPAESFLACVAARYQQTHRPAETTPGW